MHSLKRAVGLVALFLLLADPAGAEGEFSRKGMYLGVGGVMGFENFDGGDGNIGGGFDLRAGYHFTPHIAAEAQFSYIHKLDYEPGPHGELSLYMATANIKAVLSDSTRLQPFALVGLGFHNASFRTFDSNVLRPIEEVGSTVKFGGGIESHVTRHVSFVLEASYNLNSGRVLGLDVITAGFGARYRF